MKVLFVIDMQNDFIDGSLGTKEAQQIVPYVVEKIRNAKSEGTKIVFTKDTHFSNYLTTNEGKNLPVEHCIKGTYGHEVCDEIKKVIDIDQCTVYEKNTFGSKELAQDLEAGKYDDADEYEFVGLCTDICVISNVMLTKAYKPEKKIVVDTKGMAGVTVETHKNAIEAMRMCQITII